MTRHSRRDFAASLLLGTAGTVLTPSLAGATSRRLGEIDPAPFDHLRPLTDRVVPITDAERAARIERARRLMAEHKLDALLLEPGTSMRYYMNVRWGLSERPFCCVLPRTGAPVWITPGFEESRTRELTGDAEVRVWQEDESPYAVIAGALADRGVRTGTVGVEERVRFFIADGVRQAAPSLRLVSATPVTAGCRMIKSPAEIALLQAATDVTTAALKAVLPQLREGMLPAEAGALFDAAHAKLGGTNSWALVLFGEASAFPHGTRQPRALREGDIVLMDVGCEVEGYQSDVTRTTVFGRPTQRQRDVWDVERRAQDAAFAAARPGATCASVDAAARRVIEAAGFGPGYKLPGVPHRTGHGIGMDGHEWTNFVKGNDTIIRPGMCFSDEPTIAIPGEFGVRLEDCLVITADGARFFTEQSPSVEQIFPG